MAKKDALPVLCCQRLKGKTDSLIMLRTVIFLNITLGLIFSDSTPIARG